MREIIIFYHLATMGHYKEVNAEILGLVKHSGLLRACKRVNIGVVGDQNVDLLYVHDKFNIKHFGDDIRLYEFPTVGWLREYCLTNDCYVLLLANVGVSHAKDRIDYYPGWRDLDCHYCIIKWRECLQALEDGYDAVSIEWQTDPCPHFSGSFYWANSNYIKTLPDMEVARKYGLDMISSDRHGTEFWIGMNSKVKYKSFYQTGYSWRNRPIADYYEDAINKEGK